MPAGKGLYQLQMREGGRLPKELKARFTSIGEAQKAVMFYLGKKKKWALAEEEDGKSTK